MLRLRWTLLWYGMKKPGFAWDGIPRSYGERSEDERWLYRPKEGSGGDNGRHLHTHLQGSLRLPFVCVFRCNMNRPATAGIVGGTCDASCSLLMPGMDNTRHFYSITAVAGTVWYEPSISIPKPHISQQISRMTKMPQNETLKYQVSHSNAYPDTHRSTEVRMLIGVERCQVQRGVQVNGQS